MATKARFRRMGGGFLAPNFDGGGHDVRPTLKQPFSFRDDPRVARFDDVRLLAVMDGQCALCSAAARRIARWDRADQVRIAPAASDLGAGLLAHYGLDPADPQSWLVIEDGVAYGGLEAMVRLGRRLSPLFRLATPLTWLPLGVQDWLYARVARNRYALFGRSDLCALPDPALRRRLVG